MGERTLITVDDFLSNPEAARQYALSLQYEPAGGQYGKSFPGIRAGLREEDAKSWDKLLKDALGQIVGVDCTSSRLQYYFQITWSHHRSWIHSDIDEWAAVLPLTPDAPFSAGTGLFQHKATGASSTIGLSQEEYDECVADCWDETKWDLVDNIGFKYNRLVLYKGDLFHRSMDYFGRTPEEGRLFMVMFLNTGLDATRPWRESLEQSNHKKLAESST